MLDNDNLTYSYQRRSVATNAERVLITLERSQKLDLLLHLLANLQQSLIVCGPEGIGKTTLLETVRQSRKDVWDVVVLPASANSSFESLVNDMLRCLKIGSTSLFDLSALRDYCARHKVVLMVDDAGNLVPGLITTLMEFADSLAGLRLVFAMSHDQFQVKSGTDKLIEECHFIELPPLNKKQCGEYLQNLSAQPGALISFNAITDSLVEQLYRDTHGVPGKILAELPKLADVQSRKSGKLGLWLAIAAVLAGSGVVVKQLLPEALFAPPATVAGNDQGRQAGNRSAAIPTPSAEPVAANSVVVAPAPTPAPAGPAPVTEPAPSPATTVSPVQGVVSEAATAVPKPDVSTPVAPVTPPAQPLAPQTAPVASAQSPANPAQAVAAASADSKVVNVAEVVAPSLPTQDAQPIAAKAETEAKSQADALPLKVETPAVTPPASKAAARKPGKQLTEASGQEWIMAQPANHYTLQLMVLSNKASAQRFLKKYAEYGDALTYYPINNGEQEKYVLIYGSFASAAEANQLKASMPGEFKQAIEKRFRAVQKESQR